MRPVVMHNFRPARPRRTFAGTILRTLIAFMVIQVAFNIAVKVLGP